MTDKDALSAFTKSSIRPLIVSDVDNTLARLSEQELAVVNAMFNRQYRMFQWTTYEGPFALPEQEYLTEQRSNPTFFANVAPDTQAIAAMNLIHESGFPVAISSHRPAIVGTVTSRWLDYYCVKRDKELFAGPGSKDQLLAGNGPDLPAILFDDAPFHWLTVARPGVQVWSPLRPYTPVYLDHYPNVRVFSSWSEPLSWLGINPAALLSY